VGGTGRIKKGGENITRMGQGFKKEKSSRAAERRRKKKKVGGEHLILEKAWGRSRAEQGRIGKPDLDLRRANRCARVPTSQ